MYSIRDLTFIVTHLFQLDSYQFSISWSRIFPSGTGDVNQAGLDYYSSLIDAVVAANIRPVVILYAFDLPQALEGIC